MLAMFNSTLGHFTRSLVLITVFAVTDAHDFHVAVLGQTVVLTCEANVPFTEVAWRYEDRDIWRYTERNRRYDVNTDDRLLITYFSVRNVKFHDAGDYSCIQTFRRKRQEQHVYTLQVTGIPRITPTMIESKENDTILALCCVRIGLSGDHVSLLWFIGMEPLTPPNKTETIDRIDAYEVEVCSTIYFQSSRYFHDHPLVCLVPKPYNISTSLKMEVVYPPRVRMLMSSHVVPISKENEIKVICQAEGNPQPIVKLPKKIDNAWWLSSVKPTLISKTRWNTTWLFRVYNTSIAITGTYRCAAVNNLGEGYSSKTVEVIDIRRQGSVTIYLLLPIALIALLLFAVAKTDKCFSLRANIRKLLHTLVDGFSAFIRSEYNNERNDKMAEYDFTNLQTNSVSVSRTTDNTNHLNNGSIDTAYESKQVPDKQYLKLDSENETEDANGHQSYTYESILCQRKLSRSLEVLRKLENAESGPHYHTLERGTDIKSTNYEESNSYCNLEFQN